MLGSSLATGNFNYRYAIVYQKGYQDFEEVESAALTKVKGVTYPTALTYNRSIPGVTDRIWDVSDYVVPPEVRLVCVLYKYKNIDYDLNIGLNITSHVKRKCWVL